MYVVELDVWEKVYFSLVFCIFEVFVNCWCFVEDVNEDWIGYCLMKVYILYIVLFDFFCKFLVKFWKMLMFNCYDFFIVFVFVLIGFYFIRYEIKGIYFDDV